jgi:threonine aldolase
MIYFKNDYSEGAHEKILKKLNTTNLVQDKGYGNDAYSKEARKLIQKKLNDESADVHFISGGTQANLTIIGSILRPHESVIAPETGHICVHETGAIEATGHKINTVKTLDGKLTPELIKPVLIAHEDEHMVKPKLVFISNSTEIGTHYTNNELKKLSSFCKENDLYLYLDGARLGSALSVEGCDLTLAELSAYLDAFYIGGTKNGALLGEAIILNNEDFKANFRFHLKQRGGLLAKGRLIAIQFLELFKDNLYFELAKHANDMAALITEAVKEHGYAFLTASKTNQIFPVLPNKVIDVLKENYEFYVWSKVSDDTSSLRLVTSWATKEENVHQFINDLNQSVENL